MIYYAVISKQDKIPQAMFKHKRLAIRFVEQQNSLWESAQIKFSIREVDIPRPNRQKLPIVHKITWMDYITEGLRLLLTNIKTHAKR